MSTLPMIREPHLTHRPKGIKRWAMEWSLWGGLSRGVIDRRETFFTRRGAERWLERNTIKPADEWHEVDA